MYLPQRKPCNKQSKSPKSSDRDGAKIQNQIFVQFFDRNHTSVESNRQTFQIENGKVPQTPPKIDIGKLNWTDASANFDKDPIDAGNIKVTSADLEKILEEIMKHTRCPLGSFYDPKKGCVSTSTFGVVPENTNLIDIEAIFNQPLIEVPKTEKNAVTERTDVETKIPQVIQIEDPTVYMPAENEAAKVSHFLANYLKHKTFIDEGEIPLVMQALKTGALGTEMLQTNEGGEEMKISAPKLPTVAFEVGADLNELKQELAASGLGIDMEELNKLVAEVQPQEEGGVQVQSDLEGGTQVQSDLKSELQQPDDYIDDHFMIRPQFYPKMYPLQMMMNLPQQMYTKKRPPIKINLPIKFLQQPDVRIQNPRLTNNIANAIMSMGPGMVMKTGGAEVTEERTPEEEVIETIDVEETSEESLETELGEDEDEEKASKPARNPRRQAFIIHELPVGKGSFQPENENYRNFRRGQETTTTKTSSSAPTSTAPPTTEKPQRPSLLGTWINAGKDVIKAHADVLKDILGFGRQYDEDEIDEAKVRQLVHKNMRRMSPPKMPEQETRKNNDFFEQVYRQRKMSPMKTSEPETRRSAGFEEQVHRGMRRMSPPMLPDPAATGIDFGEQIEWITKPSVTKTTRATNVKPTPPKPKTVHVIKKTIAAASTKKPVATTKKPILTTKKSVPTTRKATTTRKPIATTKKPVYTTKTTAKVEVPRGSVKKTLPEVRSREFWAPANDETASNI